MTAPLPSPASVQVSWNAVTSSYQHEAPDGTLWDESQIVRMVWSCLKGTYEYVAADGTRWDDRNLEATQRLSRHLVDPSAYNPTRPSARGGEPPKQSILPKYVLAMIKEEAARKKAEGGRGSDAFRAARSQLKKKLAGSLRKMLRLFERMDEDRSGTVDKEEFRKVVAAVGWKPDPKQVALRLAEGWGGSDVVDTVFDEYDADKSGEVSYSEYIRYALRSGLQRQCGRVMDLFAKWDSDGSGTVEREEFYRAVAAVGFDAPIAELDQLFEEVDLDASGSVSFKELNSLLRQGASVQLAKELQDGAAGEIKLDASNKIALRKDKHQRTGPLRAATVDELRKALASRAQRAMDLFRSMDKDSDGSVTKKEFRAALPLLGFDASSTEAIDGLFDTFDADASGKVEFDELHRLLRQGASVVLAEELQDGAAGEISTDRSNKISLRKDITERSEPLKVLESVAQLRESLLDGWTRVVDVFRTFDRDASGSVSKSEFRGALPLLGFDGSQTQVVDALFDDMDEDGSGSIEYGEIFRKLERNEDREATGLVRTAEEIAGEKLELVRGMGALAESQQLWHG